MVKRDRCPLLLGLFLTVSVLFVSHYTLGASLFRTKTDVFRERAVAQCKAGLSFSAISQRKYT